MFNFILPTLTPSEFCSIFSKWWFFLLFLETLWNWEMLFAQINFHMFSEFNILLYFLKLLVFVLVPDPLWGMLTDLNANRHTVIHRNNHELHVLSIWQELVIEHLPYAKHCTGGSLAFMFIRITALSTEVHGRVHALSLQTALDWCATLHYSLGC